MIKMMRKGLILGMAAAMAASVIVTAETPAEKSELTVTIPDKYKELVTVTEEEPDLLISVSETASIEAAKAQGDDFPGAGWLFGISKISEEELHEKLCNDMSGEEVFAQDAEGNYLVYCHPTDVRFVREQYENIDDDMAQWTELNEWAATVCDTIVAENEGLTPVHFGNTVFEIFLNRIAYAADTKCEVSTLEHGPLNAFDVDAASFAKQLLNASYEVVDDDLQIDGEYIVLSFADEETRFDFFESEGNECYVRQVWGPEDAQNVMYYKAVFEDGTAVSSVMRTWYDELVKANGLAG